MEMTRSRSVAVTTILIIIVNMMDVVTSTSYNVTWICSTAAAKWVEKSPASVSSVRASGSLGSAVVNNFSQPNNICSPMQDVNCPGNDIQRFLNIKSGAGCCNECKATEGCYAWTYDTTSSHAPFCFVKSRCDFRNQTGGTVVSGTVPPPPTPPPPPPGVTTIYVNTSMTFQTMEGFGGCFNEKGWDALSVLNQSARDDVMTNLFSLEQGLKWRINRMPVGSSDFADSYYSLDDTAGDLSLVNLSLTRDNTKLIPFIKAAMAVQPDLKTWGSPWTGPHWMKDSANQTTGYGCGSLSNDTNIRAAYALYLAKAAKAYRAAGLNFEHLAIQNEPNQGALFNSTTGTCGSSYPKMHWTGEQLHSFLKNHLGPTFASEGLSDTVGIFLATFPVDDYQGYVEPTLTDPDAVKYLSGVGLQYSGVGMAASIHTEAPRLKLWETETPCGSGRKKACGDGPGTHNNSWAWGQGQFDTMVSFIEAGVTVYSQWNMVLDETGESGWGWSQCSPVTVDRATHQVTYEGSYWATKHFSFFVEPGAKKLTTTVNSGDDGDDGEHKHTATPPIIVTNNDNNVDGDGDGIYDNAHNTDATPLSAISFLSPNNEVIVIVNNKANVSAKVVVQVDGIAVPLGTLPALSMNTFTMTKM